MQSAAYVCNGLHRELIEQKRIWIFLPWRLRPLPCTPGRGIPLLSPVTCIGNPVASMPQENPNATQCIRHGWKKSTEALRCMRSQPSCVTARSYCGGAPSTQAQQMQSGSRHSLLPRTVSDGIPDEVERYCIKHPPRQALQHRQGHMNTNSVQQPPPQQHDADSSAWADRHFRRAHVWRCAVREAIPGPRQAGREAEDITQQGRSAKIPRLFRQHHPREAIQWRRRDHPQ
jgi:hypothetical protein